MTLLTRRTRALLRHADPARTLDPLPPAVPAHLLIARADRTAEVELPVRPGSPAVTVPADEPPAGRVPIARRSMLIGAAAGVTGVALGSAVLARGFLAGGVPEPAAPAGPDLLWDDLLTPVEFEADDAPVPAADRLRELAGRLAASPVEDGTGEYLASYERFWERSVTAPDRPPPSGGEPAYRGPDAGLGHERWVWYAPGRVTERVTALRAEFVTAEARDAAHAGIPDPVPTDVAEHTVSGSGPSPQPIVAAPVETLIAGLAGAGMTPSIEVAVTLVRRGAGRAARALFLRALADGQPQWVWRGAVVDRAGRAGVAISTAMLDPRQGRPGYVRGQVVLVLHPETGELLCVERVGADGGGLTEYRMFLGARHVGRSGQTW